MKTIYLDSDFRCHLENDGTMTAVETDVFDGKCSEYIEGYRYVPDGETWTRADGVEFHGEMIAPAEDYGALAKAQAQYELDETQRWGGLGIPQEQGFTATRRYAIGSFLSVFGEIYEVISIILNGAQIIPGSNVCKSTVEEYISKKSEE
jgi:hypothetical protein